MQLEGKPTAGQIVSFIQASPFRRNDKQHSASITVPLRRPTSISSAVRGLRAIYRPGFNYAKAGVMLLYLQDGDVEQGELALDDPGADRTKLMKAVDALNDRYGRRTVLVGSSGVAGDKRQFEMKRERKTRSTRPLERDAGRPRPTTIPQDDGACATTPVEVKRYTVAVRELCAFAAKAGDLDHRFTPSPTAQDGIEGHQIVAGRRGRTRRIEEHTNVGFALVLYTPCDTGSLVGEPTKPRARQNVVFEHGY